MRAVHFVVHSGSYLEGKKPTLISTVLTGLPVRRLCLTFSKRLWAALNSNGFKHMLKCFPEGRPKDLHKC